MGWEFPALLVGALVLSLYLGLWQHRRYAAAVNRLAREQHAPGRVLVTGRGQGRVRGTIVMLVVDQATREVVAAQSLRGATVFAQAKPAPELLGPIDTLLARVEDRTTRKAVTQALEQLDAHSARTKISVPNPQASPPAAPRGQQ